MVKVIERLGLQGPYLNIVKTIYTNQWPTINLMEKKKHEAIPLKSGTRQGCPLFPYLFNILGFQSRAIRQQKEIKGIQIAL
jgi:hypothetical protein